MKLLVPQVTDRLSSALDLMRVRSTIWCRSDFRAPWGFAVPARDAAAFHLVVSGACVVDFGDEPIALATGDLVIVPSGAAHRARSDASAAAPLLSDLLNSSPPRNGRIRAGGTGARTELLCGGFEIDDPSGRTRSLLPRRLVVRRDSGGSQEAIAATIKVIAHELGGDQPGVDAVVTRLSDALLVLAIRACLAEIGDPRLSTDAAIFRVVRSLESAPEQAWSLDDLGALAGLSRSVFVARFRAATGESPMRFLSQLRMRHAAEMLHDREATLDLVAAQTGFDSAATLSRAFKRRYGTPPGAFRRRLLASASRGAEHAPRAARNGT